MHSAYFVSKRRSPQHLYQYCFDFFHFTTEGLVYCNTMGYLTAGVKHSAMVTITETTTNLAIGHISKLMAEIHGKLTGLNNILFTALRYDFFLLDARTLTYHRYDIIGRQVFLSHIDRTAYDTFGQFDVYLTIIDHGVGHDGVDNAKEEITRLSVEVPTATLILLRPVA